MSAGALTLVLEMSASPGSMALVRDHAMLGCIELPQRRRHDLSLTPTLEQWLKNLQEDVRNLRAIHLTTGPGAFTSLRVAIATTRMLAMALPLQVVAVPTAQLYCHAATQMNLPRHRPLLLAINPKRHHAYMGLLRFDPATEQWEHLQPMRHDSLATSALSGSDKPIVLASDLQLLDWARGAGFETVKVDPAQLRADCLWPLSRRWAAQGRFTAPADLQPIYGREPEAVTLWEKRRQTPGTS